MNTTDEQLGAEGADLSQTTRGKISGKILLRHTLPAFIAAPVLTLAADMLLFESNFGVNLPILLTLVATALVAIRWSQRRPSLISLLGVMVAALLLVEAPTTPAMLLASFALGNFALDVAGLLTSANGNPYLVAIRAAVVSPLRLLEVLSHSTHVRDRKLTSAAIGGTFAAAAVPLLLGFVFIALFAAANPLVDKWLSAVMASPSVMFHPGRLIFWGFAFASVWALLRPRLKHLRPLRTSTEPGPSLFFGTGSLFVALVLFNLMFAVQSGLDLTFLWAGAELPDGMTYAEYAHRGAYPLVATALLAALFVLVAMRRNGPGEINQSLRWLVYLFIAQNILLCVSAIFRLDLYVEQYLLTEFRLVAGAWMLLVMAGLIFIIARIRFAKSNSWLWSANLTALGVVIAIFAAVDTASLVANYNVARSQTQESAPLDIRYLETLGPAAIPALDIVITRSGDWSVGIHQAARQSRETLAKEFAEADRDWRSWNWRSHRIGTYLASRSENGD